jgi:hypothetical protein
MSDGAGSRVTNRTRPRQPGSSGAGINARSDAAQGEGTATRAREARGTGGASSRSSPASHDSVAARAKVWAAHAGNVSEAIPKHGITNIQGCRYVVCVAAIGQPEPGRPGSRRASAGTTRRFQPVLTHRSLEDAAHEPSRGLTVVVVMKRAPRRRQSSLPAPIVDRPTTP